MPDRGDEPVDEGLGEELGLLLLRGRRRRVAHGDDERVAVQGDGVAEVAVQAVRARDAAAAAGRVEGEG